MLNNKKTQKEFIKIGEVEFEILFPDLLPKQSPDEYKRLKDDIEANGVTVPIVTDEAHGVIDGQNRLRAASELKMKKIGFIIVHSLGESEKKNMAITLNTKRRQMSKDERLELAINLRKNGLSYR